MFRRTSAPLAPLDELYIFAIMHADEDGTEARLRASTQLVPLEGQYSPSDGFEAWFPSTQLSPLDGNHHTQTG